ncbi:MAG: heavy metal translocating P-type ATPase, partial [Mycobacterium sp.]|nr:heavy metal translocating P-type ATPase [Mycobacterium sp.]
MNEHTSRHTKGHTGHTGHAPTDQAQADHAGHQQHAQDVGDEHHAHHTGHDEHAGHGDHSESGAAQQSHDRHSGHGDHGGHGGHAGHGDHVGQFRRLFWIMLVLAVPVVGFNEMFAHLLGYHLPDAEWVWWVSPVLGTVIYAWGGWPFLTGALSEARSRKPGMMLLIGLAITVAFIASWGATLHILDHELNFWWELALLVVIMLLGHWIEMRSLAQTTSALDSLAALLPDEAEKIDGDDVVKVAPADLAVGDLVIVRPGSAVPADGRIVDGSASMDESMVTGESKAVRREIGEQVVAGTVATDSGL